MPKEFLGAFKRGHRRSSQEFIDEEFSEALLVRAQNGCTVSLEALKWLTRFNNEYHKNVIVKGDPEALHLGDELRSDCYRRDYSRRNDLYTSAVVIKGKPYESFEQVRKKSRFKNEV